MTTGLLLDTANSSEGGDNWDKVERKKLSFVDHIRETIEPFQRRMDEGFEQELFKIINDAVSLYREISRQVATVIWVFENGKFDPSSMELEAGENPKAGNHEVQLIVSPGLKKRGKSTGEDFKVENTLLLMEVSCEPVTSGGVRR